MKPYCPPAYCVSRTHAFCREKDLRKVCRCACDSFLIAGNSWWRQSTCQKRNYQLQIHAVIQLVYTTNRHFLKLYLENVWRSRDLSSASVVWGCLTVWKMNFDGNILLSDNSNQPNYTPNMACSARAVCPVFALIFLSNQPLLSFIPYSSCRTVLVGKTFSSQVE